MSIHFVGINGIETSFSKKLADTIHAEGYYYESKICGMVWIFDYNNYHPDGCLVVSKFNRTEEAKQSYHNILRSVCFNKNFDGLARCINSDFSTAKLRDTL